MLIMAEIWKEWASRETIVASGKRVGIPANGLNVDWMQQDKFDQAAACIQIAKSPSKNRITSTPIVQSPMDERPGGVRYWKKKWENALEVISLLSDSSFDLENIPGLQRDTNIDFSKTQLHWL